MKVLAGLVSSEGCGGWICSQPLGLAFIAGSLLPVCVEVSPFCKNTSHIVLRPTLIMSFSLDFQGEALSPNKRYTLRF